MLAEVLFQALERAMHSGIANTIYTCDSAFVCETCKQYLKVLQLTGLQNRPFIFVLMKCVLAVEFVDFSIGVLQLYKFPCFQKASFHRNMPPKPLFVCVHGPEPDHALTSWPTVMKSHRVQDLLMRKMLWKCLKYPEWKGETEKLAISFCLVLDDIVTSLTARTQNLSVG